MAAVNYESREVLIMKAIAAREAKNRFGVLIDAAQREPVAIEKHGRAVAVMMSVEEYRKIKLERLRKEVNQGLNELDNGEYIAIERGHLQSLFADLRASGDARRVAGD